MIQQINIHESTKKNQSKYGKYKEQKALKTTVFRGNKVLKRLYLLKKS